MSEIREKLLAVLRLVVERNRDSLSIHAAAEALVESTPLDAREQLLADSNCITMVCDAVRDKVLSDTEGL